MSLAFSISAVKEVSKLEYNDCDHEHSELVQHDGLVIAESREPLDVQDLRSYRDFLVASHLARQNF